MSGSENLDFLLKEASPILDPEQYVFVTRPVAYGAHADWQPIATFKEEEGLTMVITQAVADAQGLVYESVFKRITLQVHSSLNAVGLTARFAERLAAQNISANVFAGFYHDHIFVGLTDGGRAMSALSSLSES